MLLSLINLQSILLSSKYCTKAVSVGSPNNVPSLLVVVSLHKTIPLTNAFTLLSSFSLISTNSPLDNVYNCLTVILFIVSVPVLSEQITWQHPSVSTAGKCFTIALFFDISLTPIANTIVTTALSPSGIAATAIATAVIKLSTIESIVKPFLISEATNITIAIPNIKIDSIFAVLFN